MAKRKNPKGSNPPGDKDGDKKNELPEWLRTDDWLQITPPPAAKGLPETPSGRIPVGLPPSRHDDQTTDMIQLDDDDANVEVPPSTMLFSDPDDSVVLSDDLFSAGPLSGKLKPSSSSSLRLPKIKVDVPDALPSAEIADNDIDLGSLPEVENPITAGPPTSSILLGQPLAPTQPASGWLGNSGTKLPSMPNVAASWGELDLPPKAAEPPKPTLPTPTAEQHPQSWHPGSGDIGVPSMANIDLPPDEQEGGSDIFRGAKNPGLAAGTYPVEPMKIARPKAPEVAPPVAVVPVPPAEAKIEATPATPSLQLPSLPNVPAEPMKGSWHPSSGNVNLPSQSDIDLPPDAMETSDVFRGAKNPGLAPPSATPVVPANVARKPEPQWLDATNFSIIPDAVQPTEPASGWLSGASKAAKGEPPATTDVPAGLQATFAEIDLPPVAEPEPSDIFSTARPAGQPSVMGDSGLFTGAQAPDSSFFNDLAQPAAGASSLFTDDPTETSPESGRVDVAAELNVSPVLPGSKTDAVTFAMPTDDDNMSGVEVLDTSGILDPGDAAFAGPESAVLSAEPIIEDDSLPGAEFGDGIDLLDAELVDDDLGRPDFNIFPGSGHSDSNLLGDRTLVDAGLLGPSSSVNLADPNALSRHPTADSGQASSIFNKPDQASAGGKIDLDSIPLMGSSDDGTMPLDSSHSAVLGGRLDDPNAGDLEASVFDVTMPRDESADSGMIDWSTDAAKVTDRLGEASNRQPTMDRTQRSEIPDDDDDDMPVTPRPAARKAEVKRPVSRPDIDLGDESPKAKGKGGLLIGALSLLAGAGIGAGGMFLAGGSGDTGPKPDPAALAAVQTKLTAAEQTAAELQKKADENETALKAAAAAVAPAVEEAKTATAAKMKLEADLAAAKKKADDDLAAAAKKAEDDLAFTKKKADDLEADKTKLLADAKKAAADAVTLMAAVTAAKDDVTTKGKELDAAKLAADAVAAKLKAADATLDPVIDKLKAAKLIDEKADREKAIAALPEALKKANLVTGEGDTAKMAKELSDVRDLLKKEKADADKLLKASEEKLTMAQKDAEKQLADAKLTAEKSMADLQKKVDTADVRIKDEVKTAVAAATKEAEAKIAKAQEQAAEQQKLAAAEVQQAKLARAADAKAFDEKMAGLTEQFQKQLTAAKSGAVVPLTDAGVAKAAGAATAFDAGTTAYFAGRYTDAERSFATATQADAADARYWYFLGLSRYAQGNTGAADAAFKTGADWESRGKPGRRGVATALESIQGPARRALEAARP